MFRSFPIHTLNQPTELSGMWTFQAEGREPIQVYVPSAWETYPGYESYRGKAVYSRDVLCTEETRFVFEGVSHTADVYLDDQLLAHHYNAFTAFEAIATGLEPGIHRLSVHVSNEFNEESALHTENDYYTFGGITRACYMEELDSLYVQSLHLTPVRENDAWALEIEAVIRNVSEDPQEFYLEAEADFLDETTRISEPQELAAGASVTICRKVAAAGAETYSPDHPKLYEVAVYICDPDPDEIPEDADAESYSSIYDDRVERVGFRTIEVKGDKILYNGKELQIRGFNRHEYHPAFGCAIPPQIMDSDLNLFLDTGANAVRTSHYPQDPLFLDLCDEKGIMVWEENHARGFREDKMRNPHFEDQCENVIREMIRDDYNHPSIIIWGLLNECASETEYGRGCYEKQFALLKSLDHSRPTSFASCKHFNDICLDLPDIVSFNIYPGWYDFQGMESPEVQLQKLLDWIQTTPGAGKPFLITEIGAGGIYGYRNPNMDKWTEDNQAEVLSKQIPAVLNNPAVSGIFIWQFCDVRVTRSWAMMRPRQMNNKGIVDEYRRPKLAYYTVKKLYHELTK